jgi:hypothetical protein
MLFSYALNRNIVKPPRKCDWGKERKMKGIKEDAGKVTKDEEKPATEAVPGKLAAMPRPRKARAVKNQLEEADYFGEQYCRTEELDNPENLLRMLATAVVEVIAGVRNISQLGAHLSEEVYGRLRDRSVKVAQEQAKRGQAPLAPKLRVANMMNQEPRDGVVESVVLVQSPTRTRAVTIRLEGINRRWRATSVSVI